MREKRGLESSSKELTGMPMVHQRNLTYSCSHLSCCNGFQRNCCKVAWLVQMGAKFPEFELRPLESYSSANNAGAMSYAESQFF